MAFPLPNRIPAWAAQVTNRMSQLQSRVFAPRWARIDFPSCLISDLASGDPPTRHSNTFGSALSFSSDSDNILYISAAYPVDWARTDTQCYPSLYFYADTSSSGNIVWEVLYKLTDPGGYGSWKTVSYTFTISSTVSELRSLDFSVISLSTSFAFQPLLDIAVRRKGTADTYGGNALLKTFGWNYKAVFGTEGRRVRWW